MDTIYHIADIHFKDTRRDEYRNVIDNFIEQIIVDAKRGDDANHPPQDSHRYVVIAGDIFDLKTRLSAVNIMDFMYLINSLLSPAANINEIITIMGNHDINLNHPESIDLIAPFVDGRLWGGRVFHYSKNGTYVHGNIAFNVLSPNDKLEFPWANNEHMYNVLLFHENVNDLKCCGGCIRGRIEKHHFDKYDAVMGGHIHEFTQISPTAIYSGALIQQNVGESFVKGFVKWTFPGKAIGPPAYVFHPIINSFGFIKFTVRDNKLIMHGEHDYIPRNPQKIVVEVKNSSPEMVTKLCARINRDYDLPPEIKSRDTIVISHNDIVHTDKQLELLKEMLDQHHIEPELANDVIQLHKLLKQCTARPKNTIELIGLEWANLFCYADHNSIDFRRLDGKIAGIIAPNKTGKSSIVDILILALYNKLLRGQMKHVINKYYKSASIKVTLNINGDKHEIMRVFYYGGVNKISHVINGVNETEQDVTAVYAHIEKLIGDYNHFISSVILTQDRRNDYIYMSPVQQNEYLSKLLGLDILAQNLSFVKDERVKTRAMLKTRPAREYNKLYAAKESHTEKISSLRAQINEHNEYIEANKDVIPTAPRNCLSELEREYETVLKYVKKHKPPADDIQQLRDELINLHKSLPEEPSEADKKMASTAINKATIAEVERGISLKSLMIQKIDLTARVNEIDQKAIANVINKYGAGIKSSTSRPAKTIVELRAGCDRVRTDLDKVYNEHPATDNRHLSKYCEWDIDSARADVKLYEQIDLLSAQIVQSIDTTQIKKQIGALIGPPKKVQQKIDEIYNNIYSVAYSELRERLRFDTDCLYCSQNKSIIDDSCCNTCSDGDGDGDGGITSLRELNEQKTQGTILYDRLRVAEKNDQLRAEIKRVRAGIKNSSAKRYELHEFVDNYDMVLLLIDNNNRLAELRTLLNNTLDELHLAEYFDACDKKQTIQQLSDINDKIATAKIIDAKSRVNKYIKCTKLIARKEAAIESLEKYTAAKDYLAECYKSLLNCRHETEQYEADYNIHRAVTNKQTAVYNILNTIHELELSLQSIEADLAQYDKLRDTEYYDKQLCTYEKCLNYRNGIPMKVLSSSLKDIEADTNKILGELCDFRILFKHESTRFNLYIVDDKEIPIDLGSGYQKIIISLALRNTFVHITSNSLPNFLIIDEGFGCLDEINQNRLVETLPQLKQIYKFILLISHIDIIKNCIEYPLYIKGDRQKVINDRVVNFSQFRYGNITINSAAFMAMTRAALVDEKTEDVKNIKDTEPADINVDNILVYYNAEGKEVESDYVAISKYHCRVCMFTTPSKKKFDRHIGTKTHAKHMAKWCNQK